MLNLFRQHSLNATGRIAKMVARRENRITRMVILMAVAFNVCWAPYACVALIELFQQHFVSPLKSLPGFFMVKW